MNESVSYKEFGRTIQRVLFDEWLRQMAAGYLTEAGLLNIRTRLLFTSEFTPGTDRDLMLLHVNEAYAAMHGTDPSAVPTDPELTVPDDASELEPPP
jgi:hypothetical protein